MFPKAQKIREIVRSEVDRDLLGTKADKWNSSVTPARNVQRVIGEDMTKVSRRFVTIVAVAKAATLLDIQGICRHPNHCD